MITFEIILFILALLFGILLYWRESKNNKIYRLINKLTHSKEQQMHLTNTKGFVYKQPFVMRLVYIVLFVLITYLLAEFLTPVKILDIKYLTTIVVGTIIGTYFGTFVVAANKKILRNHHLIKDTLQKGKDFIDDFSKEEEEIKEPKYKTINKKTKKSARERLKDKGFLE